jgi:threonine/homoserine/homoserine lactone efflux protein
MSLFGLAPEKLALFAVAVLLLALTPGPVWLYLISRTLAQGRRAGYFSLFGVALGLLLHVLAAALGLSALLLALPWAFDAIKVVGAVYLLWLAVSTLRGGGASFTPQPLPPVADRVLLRQSLIAAAVNPKVAVFFLSVFPQFVDPAAGLVLAQALLLGAIHVAVSAAVDALLVTVAGALAAWFAGRPLWLRVQRWIMGGAFGVLAVWLLLARREPAA